MSAAARLVRAEDRLRRLLVMLPWLMEVGRVPIVEVASRFDMSEADVVRDLELVAMCGLPPYVDEMVDVFVDEGDVFVGVPRLFRRSLRLTAPEAFSLLAAARTALELPGADADGALRRGVERVADALRDVGVLSGGESADGDATAGVEIDLERPVLADDVTDAVADGAELAIEYYSPSRDDVTARTIVPRHVFVDRGHWYVRADDQRSGDARTFRIDRIERVERTGRHVAVDPALAEPVEFFADPDVGRVRVRLAPSARWVVDRYPHDEVDDGAGPADRDVTVTLPVASDWWLARLLVRLGPDASVEEPPEAADLGAELAARILQRYR